MAPAAPWDPPSKSIDVSPHRRGPGGASISLALWPHKGVGGLLFCVNCVFMETCHVTKLGGQTLPTAVTSCSPSQTKLRLQELQASELYKMCGEDAGALHVADNGSTLTHSFVSNCSLCLGQRRSFEHSALLPLVLDWF